MQTCLHLPSFLVSRRWLGAFLALAILAPAAPAQAASILFAQFAQTSTPDFHWTSNSSTGTFTASTNVQFNFTAATGLPTTMHNATLTLSATTTAKAVASPPVVNQPINTVSTLTITEIGTGTNLLTMAFTGNMVGILGSSNASLLGDTDSGNTVTYTSALFPQAASGSGASYLIGLPSINPLLAINPSTNFLADFTTTANGAFSVAVPAPASIAMLGTGVMAPGALALLRRKRKVKAAQA